MRRTFLATLACAIALAFASGSASAQGTLYRLGPDSDHEMGCFGPCACPVLIHSPMTGTFRLRLAGIGEAEEHYQITSIDWEFLTQDGIVHVTGSGLYNRVFGTPPSQSMTLDLSLDGKPPMRFDSTLDPVSVAWPQIDIMVSRHQAFCWDTVFTISASPATAGDVAGSDRPRLASSPSPFRDRVDLSYVLPAADDRVELAVFEASGRRVRTLSPGSWQAAGPHSVTWDGADDRGRPVAAGVLFVRLRTSSGSARTTLVRVR